MNGGVYIPFEILSYKIPPSAKLCYGLLKRFAGKDGKCYPSQRVLAEELSVSRRQVIRILKILEKEKLIAKGKKTKRTNNYVVEEKARLKSKRVSTLDLFNFLKLICIENKYHASESMDVKDSKYLLYLINALKHSGLTPQQYIERSVRAWERLRNRIKNERGKLKLKAYPNIKDLFLLRDEILQALTGLEEVLDNSVESDVLEVKMLSEGSK